MTPAKLAALLDEISQRVTASSGRR